MKTKTPLVAAFTASITISFIIGSCKKVIAVSSDSIVGSWKNTAYIHNGKDVYGTGVGPCIIDDIFTFTNDQRIIMDEGPTKCHPSDPQTIEGTYSLNNDKSQLTITGNGTSGVDKVLTLNSTTLKLEQLDNGDVITYERMP